MKRYKNYLFQQAVFVLGEQKAKKYLNQRRIGIIVVFVTIGIIFLMLAFWKHDRRLFFLYPFVSFFLAYYMFDYQITSKAKNLRRQMRLELAEVLERMAVLLDAGVTLWTAIVIVSQDNGSAGAFEKELSLTVNKFDGNNGYYYDPESAFEQMAIRCADSTVSTFVSLIMQNARKGTDELAELLRLQAVNARNERRMLAKQLAEEATTLMLIPSVLVLISIMILAVAPAVVELL